MWDSKYTTCEPRSFIYTVRRKTRPTKPATAKPPKPARTNREAGSDAPQKRLRRITTRQRCTSRGSEAHFERQRRTATGSNALRQGGRLNLTTGTLGDGRCWSASRRNRRPRDPGRKCKRARPKSRRSNRFRRERVVFSPTTQHRDSKMQKCNLKSFPATVSLRYVNTRRRAATRRG